MLLLLQQSPPSKLQFELLFSSSQYVSLTHCGLPQPDGVGVEIVVVVVVVVVVLVVCGGYCYVFGCCCSSEEPFI